ncbi:MAG: PadR family transcriptional regulator [Actinomycetales bacterium]|nr:PadR family transcriptional regulator [Actinomycetales bacterium]
MSSIRLYILAALAERGPMHGHALVGLAEEEHVDEWTDISVGGVYGAVRRLAAEGAIESVRVERLGNYPERQVYAITESGRAQLGELRDQMLTELVWRHDPFDLALTRSDPAHLGELEDVLRARRSRIERRLEEHVVRRAQIRRYLSELEYLTLAHGEHRLRAELSWLDELLEHLDDIVRDETARKDTP